MKRGIEYTHILPKEALIMMCTFNVCISIGTSTHTHTHVDRESEQENGGSGREQSKYDILGALDFDLNIFSLPLPFPLHFMLIYGE